MADEVTMSIGEFQHLQETINKLKQDAYDWSEREKKYKQRLEAAKATQGSGGGQGGGGWFGGGGNSKQEVQELKKALANMKRLLAQTKEEHFVQAQAMRENMQNLVAENESMAAQLQESNTKLLAAVSFSANAPTVDQSPAAMPSNEDGLVPFEGQQQELIDRHAEETRALQGQVDALQAAAAESTAILREEELTALRAEVASLRDQLDAAKEEAKEESSKEATVESESGSTDSDSAAAKREDEVSQREERLVMRERELSAREESISKREADLSSRQEELSSADAALKQRESELTAKMDAFKAKEEALQLKEKALDDQKSEIATHTAELKSTRAAAVANDEKEAKERATAAQEELDTVRQAMQHTQERLVMLTEEKNNITIQLADMAAANEALKAEVAAAKEASTASLNDTVEKSKGELSSVKEQFEKTLADVKETLSNVEQEATRAKAAEANAKEELMLTQQDREIIISKMAEKDLEIDELKDEVKTANALAEAAKKAGEEQAELERAKGQQVLAKKVQDMTEEADMLRKKVKILQQQLTEEEKEHARQLQEMNSTSERASDFEELVSLKSKEIRDLRSQLADTQAMMEAAQDVAAEARKRADDLQEQFTGREESIIQITEKYRRVESELNAMSIRKEEVVSRNQAVIDEIKDAHAQEKQELQQQLQDALHRLETTTVDHEALRRQHTKLSKSHENCGSRIEELNAETASQAEELATLKSEQEQVREELASLKEALSKAESSLEDVEQEKLEAEMQHQVENKKTQRLVKDLQARLAQRSASAPVPVVETAPAPAAAPVRRREASTGTPVASPAPARRSTDGTPATARRTASAQPSSVSTDVEALGLKVGELQKRTFDQQEHIRKLREKLVSLNEQLKKKNAIIQQHLAKMPVSGRATPAMDSHKLQRAGREAGFMSRLFGGPAASDPESPSVTAKISRVLEDTILRNVQLQQDMDTMGHEIDRLATENKQLREQAGS